MKLSGEQFQQIQSALIDAFPTGAMLEQILSFRLNKNLRAIAGEGSLQDIVFRLIQVAESQRWLQDLIPAALESNPGNVRLRDVAQDLTTRKCKQIRDQKCPFVIYLIIVVSLFQSIEYRLQFKRHSYRAFFYIVYFEQTEYIL